MCSDELLIRVAQKLELRSNANSKHIHAMNQAIGQLYPLSKKVKLSEKDRARFFSKVVKVDGRCWEWTGYKDKDGYGKFWLNDANPSAHRVMLIITKDPNGEDDYSNLMACHHCDNPGCVNPDHLYFGTNRDNINDMMKRGRTAHGEKNGNTSLSEDEVSQIRFLYAQGNTTSRRLAKQFGVGKSTILRILKGKSWRYLESSAPPPGIKKPDYLTFVEELFRWG